MIQKFYEPTKEIYLGLGKLYAEHKEFNKFYESFAPSLAKFLGEAINVFADQKWS